MVRLECTIGNHNKFYELHYSKNNGRVTVKGLYGAIGQAPQEAVIYDGDSESEAVSEMQKKQNEKVKKGYVVVTDGKDSPAPPEKKSELPVIWPMNAVGVRDENHLISLFADDKFAAQEKLDGMRAIVHVTRTGLRIFSRSAGVDDPTHPLEKTSSLPHLAYQKYPQLAGTIIDGEILLPGSDSATLSGSIHSKTVSPGNRLVKLFAFDILQLEDRSLLQKPLRDRIYWLNILSTRMHSPYIVFLPWAYSSKEKKQLYDEVLDRGGEGIMLKRLDALYLQGCRPVNNWFKAKKSSTFDCIIVGFTKGKGKYNSRIGVVVFGQYVNGKLTELGQASGMPDAIREDMSISPHSYIGRVAVIKGMERLKSGAIRHPVFTGLRSDKLPKDCIWYPNER